jgi:myosin-5
MIKQLEIKPLCSLILKKTINDEDKYQSGLTKIFFRAGMLAALESLRSDRLNALVTLVQKNLRRRIAVKRYREMRKAAIAIQTWWRGVMARRLVQLIRKDVTARRLQTAIRRYQQRSKFLAIRNAIIKFQSSTCSFSTPVWNDYTHIHSGVRGARARQLFRNTRRYEAATRLQSLFRGL